MTDHRNHHKILTEIDAFLAEVGMSDSTFGRLAVGNWRAVKRLRQGLDVRVSTLDKLRAFMAEERRRKLVEQSEASPPAG